MTIDERLEKLTERHEALTQSVELMQGNHKRIEAEIEALTRSQAKTERWIRRLGSIFLNYTAAMRAVSSSWKNCGVKPRARTRTPPSNLCSPSGL